MNTGIEVISTNTFDLQFRTLRLAALVSEKMHSMMAAFCRTVHKALSAMQTRLCRNVGREKDSP